MSRSDVNFPDSVLVYANTCVPHPDTDQAARLREEIRGAVEKQRASLADPSAYAWLPFPSLKHSIPSRFARQGRSFYFVGRPQVEDVLKQIKERLDAHHHLQWLGTIGYGKSHLLAATACCLLAEGWQVVYVPDCVDLLDNAVAYHVLQDALLVAFAGNSPHIAAIQQCSTIDELVQWCVDLLPAAKDSRLVFLLDQAHAIVGDKRPRWLAELLYNRCAVKAVSLRDPGILGTLSKQRNETDVMFFGGLSEVWWCWGFGAQNWF